MLIEQLKAAGALWARLIYRVLQEEGKMRNQVFPLGHPKRQGKVGEIDDALQALVRIKELLKAHMLINPESEQQETLFKLPEVKRG